MSLLWPSNNTGLSDQMMYPNDFGLGILLLDNSTTMGFHYVVQGHIYIWPAGTGSQTTNVGVNGQLFYQPSHSHQPQLLVGLVIYSTPVY